MPQVWTRDRAVVSNELPIAQTLLWTPRAKGRPRTTFVKGGYRTYTPHETRDAEKALREQWVGSPVDGLIGLSLFMSDSKVNVNIYEMPHPASRKLRRGDIDNYAKLIMDALNGRAWVDDRQIVRLHVVEE
jgi:Holliday junction resolvase RusA-like endonuclease